MHAWSGRMLKRGVNAETVVQHTTPAAAENTKKKPPW